jgi:hypothetical protein
MPDARRQRLERLTERWRTRHEARRATSGRPPADAEREIRADALFPWRTETPAEYAARYGTAMIGYTYDDYTYADPGLTAWLQELGEILRQGSRRG